MQLLLLPQNTFLMSRQILQPMMPFNNAVTMHVVNGMIFLMFSVLNLLTTIHFFLPRHTANFNASRGSRKSVLTPSRKFLHFLSIICVFCIKILHLTFSWIFSFFFVYFVLFIFATDRALNGKSLWLSGNSVKINNTRLPLRQKEEEQFCCFCYTTSD